MDVLKKPDRKLKSDPAPQYQCFCIKQISEWGSFLLPLQDILKLEHNRELLISGFMQTVLNI